LPTHDKLGRAYARLSETKAGDMVVPDDDFGCIRGGAAVEVKAGEHGLYVDCEEGPHYLEGQDDGDDHLIGMYRPDATATVTLTHRQLRLIHDAIDVAFADDDAPIYEDHEDGFEAVGELCELLGMQHPNPRKVAG
jgi:hypothetical protein